MNIGIIFLTLLLAGIVIDKIMREKDKIKVLPGVELIDEAVFPNEEKTVFAFNTEDEYGGAHCYKIMNFKVNGYESATQKIQFVKINQDKSITPGLQDEQLAIMLIDRTKKLNKKFPCKENQEMIQCLEKYLAIKKARIEDRIERNVFKQLKK